MFKKSVREEVVFIAQGMLEAESVKILLESFNIPAYLNQESAGSVFGFTVGPLGEVEVLVPKQYIDEAKKIIDEMNTGKLESPDTPEVD
jgi:hypothetical protein